MMIILTAVLATVILKDSMQRIKIITVTMPTDTTMDAGIMPIVTIIQ